MRKPKQPDYPPEELEPWDVVTRKRRYRKPATAGGLHDVPATAALLGVTDEKVIIFVRNGELRYINVGHGKKRPRYRFADSDIQEFIEKRRQQDIPQCQSSRPQSPRRTIGTTSKSTVVGFTAARAARIEKKPKNLKG